MQDGQAGEWLVAASATAVLVTWLALIVVGLGLLRHRERWRRVALGWAAFALVVLLGHVAVWEAGVAPHFRAIITRMRESSAAPEAVAPVAAALEARLSQYEAMEVASVAVLGVLPLALLQVLMRQRVKDAMRSGW
jgi:hypothetical protein